MIGQGASEQTDPVALAEWRVARVGDEPALERRSGDDATPLPLSSGHRASGAWCRQRT